jgi:hypothetical protein
MGFLNGEYYIFLCIDMFSKHAYGIEMPDTNSNSSALISRYVLNKIGIPKNEIS